ELFVDDGAWTGGGRFEIETTILDGPADLLCVDIVVEQRNRALPVREEVDAVAHPHRIKVVGVVARDGDDARISEIGDPDLAGLAAAIPFPGFLPLEERHVTKV